MSQVDEVQNVTNQNCPWNLFWIINMLILKMLLYFIQNKHVKWYKKKLKKMLMKTTFIKKKY